MATTHFDWIPFYTELAQKLLEYKNRRDELIEFIFAEDGLRDYSDYLHLQDKTQKIDDIDPFSFIGMFNRGKLATEKRRTISQRIKDKFNLKSAIPFDFDGIPVLNYMRMFYFHWNYLHDSCNKIWDAFESMMNGDLKPWFNYCNIAQRKAESTIPLYWCKPYSYISLDSRNCDYLKKYDIDAKVKDVDSYQKLIEEIQGKMASGEIKEKNFPEISFNAWMNDNNPTQNMPIEQSMKEYVNLLRSTHNLILTGAPGTGKTYLAKQIAETMGCTENEIEFVQFHPSYDYTDFVEGLRPMNNCNIGQIGFERKDGVFKEFCKKALIKQSADSSVTDKLNSNPCVWKVSLAKTGDNPIRKYCMDNGYIGIGWNAYGDVEDFNDFEDFTDGGKNVLRAFQNQMKQGDIIASCWSENEVDAIGVVTGDYEYNDSLPEYKRLRKVDWLIKDIKENIVEINDNKKFTLSTVYKSNITVEDALKIVTRHSKQTVNNANRPFVFIIDEINRGEISKIFGELFFSIDPSYRGEEGRVQTQYQNLVEDGDIFKKGFYVPENVYIIGTMNDIDRSMESMDFAFRRRFAFKEIKADENVGMLDNLAQKDEAIERMKSLNAAIEKVEGLSSAYHIGASYFLKLNDYNGDFGKLWEYHLEGLLREYLRGMTNVDTKIKELQTA